MREVGQQKLIFLSHEKLSRTDLIRTELKPAKVNYVQQNKYRKKLIREKGVSGRVGRENGNSKSKTIEL